MSDIIEFRGIGFAPDDSLEIRRKNTMKRLQYKARNEGKQIHSTDNGDCLIIDGALVFSLNYGFIRNVNANNSFNATNGLLEQYKTEVFL
jgi:hypothetical protein